MPGLSSELPLETLEARLAQVESLVADNSDESVFAGELVRIVLSASGGVGAQLWAGDEAAPLRLLQESFLTPESSRAAGDHRAAVQTALSAAIAQREAAVVLPASQSGETLINPTLFYWIVAPLRRSQETYGAISVWLESDWDPQTVQRIAELVDTCGQLATSWFENQRLQRLRSDNQFWTQAASFLERLHSETTLDEVAFTAANGIHTLLGCDRVWVLLRTGGSSCRVLAVSGVQQPDHRSNQMRSLTKLAGALAAASLPLTWSRGTLLTDAPSLKPLINAYLDESHLAELAAIPLIRPAAERAPANCLGMLFLERFSIPDPPPPARDVAPLAGQLAVALQNARDWQMAPVAARLRTWRRTTGVPWMKGALALGITAVVLLVLVLVPTDYVVEARGELQPARRQHVFATEDGTIEGLKVKTGDVVRPGQPIIELRNLALDQERQRVSGELETAQRRIASLESTRLDFDSNPERPSAQRLQVTAELEELRVSQKSLEKQLAILDQRQKLLTLTSPLAGQIQTWDVEQLLNGRPVRRGQQLITVAETSGPWIVELQVPDNHTGDVLDARRDSQPLKVEFALATDPGRIHVGQLSKVADSTETRDPTTGPAMLAEATFDRAKLTDLRQGARVSARIHCGRRPLGYVWFIDAWRAIQRWVLF